jgi:hypothetical protein
MRDRGLVAWITDCPIEHILTSMLLSLNNVHKNVFRLSGMYLYIQYQPHVDTLIYYLTWT